ncbi:hypothetical protein MTR_1g050418 [Medicago truncatula]|uniref:Uncharacterized protein n=1 Tax=Medicago truncatula TaxID=3880 RepID=A0A072VHB5_MEDTR|nr:hypothetical protein MTR_1g050418 [Medicago truncatula]
MYSLPTLSSLYPKQKRKVNRHPMRSLTCWGIIAVKGTNKNHEDSPEDGNRIQRLARGATIPFARISCFSTHFNRGNLPPSLKLKQNSNKKVHPRKIQERDFVPKKVLPFQPDSRGKWMPNYEGTCAMTLVTTNGNKLACPVNTGAVKKYSVKNKSSISRKPKKAA